MGLSILYKYYFYVCYINDLLLHIKRNFLQLLVILYAIRTLLIKKGLISSPHQRCLWRVDAVKSRPVHSIRDVIFPILKGRSARHHCCACGILGISIRHLSCCVVPVATPLVRILFLKPTRWKKIHLTQKQTNIHYGFLRFNVTNNDIKTIKKWFKLT
jgi:hypothetical protein